MSWLEWGVGVVIVFLMFAVLVPLLWPIPNQRRIKIVAMLCSPIAVEGWTEDGLMLADGRQVQLPGLAKLPAESPALSEATQRGIEISNGRVYGLTRIHHWCGNDPVREHIARVDLSLLLTYLDKQDRLNNSVKPYLSGFGDFGQYGWRFGQYHSFRVWCRLLKNTANSPAQSAAPWPR